MLALNTSFQIHPDVITTELSGAQGKEAVLLHLGTQQYFSLNNTGLYIWRRLEERLSLAAVVERLAAEYEVDDEKARQSVLDLARELLEERLVDAIPGTS
ncbi:MAG: PqqD family protein [Candidatus Competibacteraceae bacterium]